jgi:transcription initiation factor TFIIE subunit alpha
MQEEFLKDLVSMIAGQGSEKIVEVMYKKKNVNEFLIAKKLDMTINQARNILYKLADEGLVIFMRKKDKKSGGWYTYFWTLNEYKSLIILRNKIFNEIQSLEYGLESKKSKQFYICRSCGMEVTGENALLHNFTCPECGEVFELNDNKDNIKNMTTVLTSFKEKLKLVEEEIAVLRKKEEGVRSRRFTLEAKKKSAKRAAKRRGTKKKVSKNKYPGKKKIVKKKSAKKKIGKKVEKKLIKSKVSRRKVVKRRKVKKAKIVRSRNVKKIQKNRKTRSRRR